MAVNKRIYITVEPRYSDVPDGGGHWGVPNTAIP